MLFVPGDSERKFAKAAGIGADALILDLEDAVAPSMKAQARGMVAALTWGGEDLSAAIGAVTPRHEDGSWTEPYRHVRSWCLFAAAAADVALARRVVAAFAAQPDLGTIGIDGKMYDRPHLTAAEKTLAAAGETP